MKVTRLGPPRIRRDTIIVGGVVFTAADLASGGVIVQDEGTPLATTATTINFTGAGVTATGAGATKTVDITGGGGGMGGALYTDVITGDGAEDTFPLTNSPVGTWALVSTNGADLLPTEYAIVADDIVFDVPPATDSETLVTYIFGGFVGSATDPGDIADPTMATAQEVAEKLNELMAELRTAGIIV